jgi:hypothetical protein
MKLVLPSPSITQVNFATQCNAPERWRALDTYAFRPLTERPGIEKAVELMCIFKASGRATYGSALKLDALALQVCFPA